MLNVPIVKSVAVIVLMALSFSACSKEDDVSHSGHNTNKNLLPFSIAFDLKGNPLLVDQEGNRIKPTDVQFPIKATAIERIDSISIVQYRGSHITLVKIGNRYYPMPLPHR